MVCSTAILSSSLALSLLRHSVPPSQSFVFSPYSLNTALSIVHDGATGNTQEELTNLLLNGCTPSDVADFYSSLADSVHSEGDTGVSFKSANRFYVDDLISLEKDYQKHIQDKYKVQVDNINLLLKENAANTMNDFIEEATNGKIRKMINADGIQPETKAILINAIHFLGKWKNPFNPDRTRKMTFHGIEGDRVMDFMHNKGYFGVNVVRDFATALILPYKDQQYSFFYLLPHAINRTGQSIASLEQGNYYATLDQMRDSLTGEKLVHILEEVKPTHVQIRVPTFKIESKLEGRQVLEKMGVKEVFTDDADLSKISPTPLKVSRIIHQAMIDVDEKGAEAAAATVGSFMRLSRQKSPPVITVDRPFFFGILRDDNILFLGQYV